MPFAAHDSPNPPWRVAVVGGGISGLAAANRLLEVSRENERPVELTLYESAAVLGGVVCTERRDGYLVERGADSFITNKPAAVDLCHRLGLKNQLIPTEEAHRRSLVLRKGRPTPIPEGFMLLSPGKLFPVLKSPLFSFWGKVRIALEYFVPRRSEEGDESLATFVRRRFGHEALDRLVQALVGGIYTSDPERLSLQATMPRFLEMEQEYRSLIRGSRKQARANARSNGKSAGGGKKAAAESGARYGLFVSLQNGVGELFDALRERIAARATIRLNTRVTAIEPVCVGEDVSPPHWMLTLADGVRTQVDAVILCIRATQSAELVAPFDDELAGALREIEYASSAVVVSGHQTVDVDHPLDAFGLVVPAIEKRKVLAVSFSSRKFPGRAPKGRVLLRTFVGGAMQPELLLQSDDELKKMVRSELAEMLGVRGEPEFMEVVRYDRAMPQYHLGHLDRVANIEGRAFAYSGLHLAGNAYHGVGIPDCVFSGEQAAEQCFSTAAVHPHVAVEQ